ncbi:CoA transferase [Sodalis glossinidius]|uniref:CoA transferase n=1 Tax=Sodalis glossinidius TaxID=63612 RepID=UPI0018E06C60|nr:CaiB/BaiF CoA-transferase family protein [Sodalis glossinidius]
MSSISANFFPDHRWLCGLVDLGASVTKIENPAGGDICRSLYISEWRIDGESTLFHAINRNKKSITVDLKDCAARAALRPLIEQADVVIFNYRPGVAQRLGLDYPSLKAMNPGLIYGEISGYGDRGPWVSRPGQDLLVQELSGICCLNGNASQPPLPLGLSVSDIFAGDYLVQGIIAALVHRIHAGSGCLVQVSLLETLLDLQFEVLTTWLNDGREIPSGARSIMPTRMSRLPMASTRRISRAGDGAAAASGGTVGLSAISGVFRAAKRL